MLMEPQATNPAQPLSQAQAFGSFLRAERELRQVTLAEVSSVTKIPLRTLENLEEGNWEELPPQVFVRGFVRSYARCLRMCEHEATKAYERAVGRAQGIPTPPQTEPDTGDEPASVAEPDILGRRRFELALLVIIVVILATITLSLLWRRGGHTDIQAQVAPQTAPPAAREVLDRTRA